MACDRFIHFPKCQVPAHEDLERMLTAFLGAAGTVEWRPEDDGARWFLSFAGSYSDPSPRNMEVHSTYEDGSPRERWIEVFPDHKLHNVDVITRNQDELVNGVAKRLQDAIARLYGGKIEE